MVEDVEKLGPKVQVHPGAQFELLTYSEVQILERRPAQDIPACIPKLAVRGKREDGRVKPLVRVPCARTGVNARLQIRTIRIGYGKNSGIVEGTQVRGEWQSGIQTQDTGSAPALCQRRRAQLLERQIVDEIPDESVLPIKRRPSSIPSAIQEVLRYTGFGCEIAGERPALIIDRP
jgi:hypothetical protein